MSGGERIRCRLSAALAIGFLLAVVMQRGRALQALSGGAGVLVLEAASPIADVAAIMLSLARMSQEDLGFSVAAGGVGIAGVVNGLCEGCHVR